MATDNSHRSAIDTKKEGTLLENNHKNKKKKKFCFIRHRNSQWEMPLRWASMFLERANTMAGQIHGWTACKSFWS